MNISEVMCKSVLVKSGIYGVDYAVNPYTGCQHNCVYCYAVFMRKYGGHSEPWGEFVDVKINAPTVLQKQSKGKSGRVLFSSVTDPYQPVEKSYEITRKCLQQLQNKPFFISVLTKSALVTRDIDILQKISCEVGFTFTTLKEDIKKKFEPNSSSVKQRLRALQKLKENNISTYAFFGPILPVLADSQEDITEMFAALDGLVEYVIVDKMNMYNAAWNKLKNLFESWRPELIHEYSTIKMNPRYPAQLRKKVAKAATVPVEFCF
jgi:DNA repair photolyase